MALVDLEPLQLAPLGVAAAAYARRARTLSRRGRPVPRARQASFATGLVLVLVALASPIDTIGEERLFWVHMAQHMLLGDLAPLAIVLGLTGPVLRPVLALPGVGRLRVLAHPAPALAIWVVAFYGWHLRVLYEAALAHPLIHATEHLSFFVAGVLMWAAVVEPLPGPVWFGDGLKAGYVLVVRTLGAALASIFIWAGHPFYPRYVAGERLEHMRPLSDQIIGGALMFTEGAVVTLLVFTWLFLRWTVQAERRQALLEAGHEPARAQRAARFARPSR